MVNSVYLTESQKRFIGEQINVGIGNKMYAHPIRDYRKVAVFFHELNNLGYQFTGETALETIELTGKTNAYSKELLDGISCIADAMYYLDDGLNDSITRDGWKETAQKVNEHK